MMYVSFTDDEGNANTVISVVLENGFIDFIKKLYKQIKSVDNVFLVKIKYPIDNCRIFSFNELPYDNFDEEESYKERLVDELCMIDKNLQPNKDYWKKLKPDTCFLFYVDGSFGFELVRNYKEYSGISLPLKKLMGSKQ